MYHHFCHPRVDHPYLQHDDAERMYMFSLARVRVKLAPQYCPHARPSTLRKAFSTLLLGLPHSSQEVVLFDFLLPCHPHRFLQLCSRFEGSLTILLSHTSGQIYRLLFERHVEFRRDATGIECASSFGCESALLFGFRCVAPLSASNQRGKEYVEPRAPFILAPERNERQALLGSRFADPSLCLQSKSVAYQTHSQPLHPRTHFFYRQGGPIASQDIPSLLSQPALLRP